MAVTLATRAKARAISLGINAMIGSQPEIVEYGDQYIEVRLNDAQKAALIDYLDRQVGKLFRGPQEPPDLQVRLGDVLLPWSLRYLGPALIGSAALGWIGNNLLKGRRK